jgi:oligoendopeptidase F
MAATLEDVAWDLEPLVDGEGEAGAARFLQEAQDRSATFAERYQGKIGSIEGAELAEAVAELQTISELVGRAGTYAMLRFATDTADPANGALLQRVQEQATVVETRLVFFELEWAELDDARVEELLQADGLETARHHLRTIRRYRPHLLT